MLKFGTSPRRDRALFFAVAVALYFLVTLLAEQELVLSAKQLADAACGSLLAALVVFVGLPQLLYRGRNLSFALFCLAGVTSLAVIDELLLDPMFWPDGDPRQAFSFTGLRWGAVNAGFASFSIAAMVGLYDNLESRRKLSALAELKNQAELAALKSQLNPHLLLNTLNNLYGLALEQDQRTPEMVLMLASILRYALYETEEPSASLEREVEILRAYIALQEIGIGERARIHFDVHGTVADREVAPLLILPLIENAFKHGGAVVGDTPPKIRFRLQTKPGAIHFEAENSFEPQATRQRSAKSGLAYTNNGSGIGLDNLRSRLALHYPHRHSFQIAAENGVFHVALTLQGQPA